MDFYRTDKGIWLEDARITLIDPKSGFEGWIEHNKRNIREKVWYDWLDSVGLSYEGMRFWFDSYEENLEMPISEKDALDLIKYWYQNNVTQQVNETGADRVTEIDAILEQRGKQYGDFGTQVHTIKNIMNQLRAVQDKEEVFTEEDIYNFFIVLKLTRMQTATDIDSIVDLQGYGKLIQEEKEKKSE